MAGPLTGVKVVEVAGLGPAPFGAMVLADLGADVTSIDRPDRVYGLPAESAKGNIYGRGRRSVAVDLKSPDGIAVVRRLVAAADVFIEGFRPGVAERLGLGPDDLAADHPELIYARMTGWGQEGPLAAKAGHDLNYVGLAGPLAHIGRVGQPPTSALNLLADFGGGGLLLAMGICAALVERATSGQGQVIDAAMVDGVALLSCAVGQAYNGGYFSAERGTNLFDGGAPYYDSYQTADGHWLSVAPLESQFYADLLVGLGLSEPLGLARRSASPTVTTRPTGRPCANGSPRSSPVVRSTAGWRSSPTWMPAWPRFGSSPRWPPIPTWPPGAPGPNTTA